MFLVELIEPKFSSPVKFVEVTGDHDNGRLALQYNSTTYPSDPGCPCDAFVYSISEVRDALNPENSDAGSVFVIDR